MNHKHTQLTLLLTYKGIQIPSALISFGPQAQMEDVGKFASARTEKGEKNSERVKD